MFEVILCALPQQPIAPPKALPANRDKIEQVTGRQLVSPHPQPTICAPESSSVEFLTKTSAPAADSNGQNNTTGKNTGQSEAADPDNKDPGNKAPDNKSDKPEPTELEASKAERLKLLEQKLADIVAKEKPLKEEQLRQNLKKFAISHAKAGRLDQARKMAQDLVLSPEQQAELLQQIQSIEVARNKFVVRQAGSLQTEQGSRLGRRFPSYTLPGYPSVLGSNFRLWRGRWQLGNGDLRLVFPLPIPAPFTSGFGWRVHPVTGQSRFHQGVDLGAPIGTPVVAAFSGTVTLADWAGGYGLAVVVSHKNGTQQTLYAHLSEIFVKPGDRIEQGMIIGSVGNTGVSTGPHLHFELRQLTAAGWEVADPAFLLEVALAQLTNGFQIAQHLQQAEGFSDTFAAIPPPPTMKRAIVHNF